MSTTPGNVAIDLSHHLSALSIARDVSPLKQLQKYIGREDMVSLAGGMPDPSLFPFALITVDALVPDFFQRTEPSEPSLFQWLWSLFGASSAVEKTQRFSVPKYPAHTGDINLAQALQYSDAKGLKQLQEFFREFTLKVYQPAYSNWMTLLDVGNTDGIYRSIATLCNPGEQILVEEWTYPSTLAAALPMNILPAAVKVDREGLSSVDLERVLSEWDETARGAKRPHVLYTIPIGQNPTGGTMGLERKKAIYAICVKYDVIIIEDDPYFFLQEGTWKHKSERRNAPGWGLDKLTHHLDNETRFINSLAPSFLRVDYQGRVVRLDSFSKIVAPGSRMGWITSNPRFIERLERQGETTTQAASGFSQALIAQLLTKHWGYSKLIRWLQGLQHEYTARRDFFVDLIFETFEVRPNRDPAVVAAFGGEYVYTAHSKTSIMTMGGEEKSRARLFSFVPPSSGMFVWLKFHVQDDTIGKDESLEAKIFTDIAENGLLIVPGWTFDAAHSGDPEGTTSGDVRFRISFSMGKAEQMKKGVAILAKVLQKYTPT